MTVNPNFILRELAGEWILVSICENEEHKRLLYINEIGKDIYSYLKDGLEGDALLLALSQDYEVDIQTLRGDVDEYLTILRSYGVIVD